MKGEDSEVKITDAYDVCNYVGTRAKAQLSDFFDGIAFDIITVGECIGKRRLRVPVHTDPCAGNAI